MQSVTFHVYLQSVSLHGKGSVVREPTHTDTIERKRGYLSYGYDEDDSCQHLFERY